jgi:hypothetical protein
MKPSVLAALLSTLSFAPLAFAQQPTPPPPLGSRVPAPRPDDVKSIDAILHAIYDVISGPAGDRDWNRFRSLIIPEARLTSTVTPRDPNAPPVRLLSVDDFIRIAGAHFKTSPFYEAAIVNRVETFGHISQVLGSYGSRHAPEEKPYTRGINSIQLFNDGTRWWVVSILWDEESPTNPLPGGMSASSSGH